jgi:hypothetical protein
MDDLKKIRGIKDRMINWSDDFLKTIYYNPSSPLWFQAAKETLNERKVPRDGPVVTPPPPPKKKTRKAPKEVRQANSTNWKLDREMERRMRDD